MTIFYSALRLRLIEVEIFDGLLVSTAVSGPFIVLVSYFTICMQLKGKKELVYDIWFMANTWTFEMATLRNSILASFERRGLAIPSDVPFALTEEFLGDPQKKQQWNAFVSRLYTSSDSTSLEEVGALLRAFVLPCILPAPTANSNARHWAPSLQWSEQQ